MNNREKKNLLCRENPTVSLLHSDNEISIYWCETSKGAIHFKVPVSEIPKGEITGKTLTKWLN